MSIKSKITILAINTALCILITLETVFLLYGWSVAAKVITYSIAGAGCVSGVVFFVLKKHALLKTCFTLIACAAVVITFLSVLSLCLDLNSYESDDMKIEKAVDLIKSTGNLGMAVFVIIQILQVLILPLPAVVCYVPGARIWGALTATLLASAGVIIGSFISYILGRVFGKKIAYWIAGRDTVDKYSAYIGNRGKVIFVLMQILPFFPDDILCIVAGLSSMNVWFFAATIVLVRPLIISAYCYLGTGTLIPFGGWGIYVWIAIFAVCIVLAALSLKYQDKFEKWIVSKFSKNTNGVQTEDNGSDTKAQEQDDKDSDN